MYLTLCSVLRFASFSPTPCQLVFVRPPLTPYNSSYNWIDSFLELEPDFGTWSLLSSAIAGRDLMGYDMISDEGVIGLCHSAATWPRHASEGPSHENPARVFDCSTDGIHISDRSTSIKGLFRPSGDISFVLAHEQSNREKLILQNLRHPFICKAIAADEDKNRSWYIMELAGGDMKKYLDGKPGLLEEEAKRFIGPIYLGWNTPIPWESYIAI